MRKPDFSTDGSLRQIPNVSNKQGRYIFLVFSTVNKLQRHLVLIITKL